MNFRLNLVYGLPFLIPEVRGVVTKIDGVSQPYCPEPAANQKVAAASQTFSKALTEESSTSNSQVCASAVQFFGGWTVMGTTHAPASAPVTPAAPANVQAPATPPAPAGAQAPAAPAQPFVPQFQTNVQVRSAYGDAWPLNPAYFATQQTAQYIADKFGTGKIAKDSLIGTGGPYAETADPYDIVLANGAKVNAGLLADYYVRMPEAQFPGLADTMIQQAVAKAEQSNG